MKGHFEKVRELYERISYVFQGGGALGAYQVGAYEILHEYGYEPDWVVGNSIGAINGAIIVGNAPEDRLKKLHDFWSRIATPEFRFLEEISAFYERFHNVWGSQVALFTGQKDFFEPRLINPWLLTNAHVSELSFYDTRPLIKTLNELIDFDRLNASDIVYKISAVQVDTGQLKYFNNQRFEITADHILASCALPPGFPAVKINDHYYWDGGVHSNTPLNLVLDALPARNTLCFMVDLFSSIGPLPNTMEELLARKKDINFASQSQRMTKLYSTRQNLRLAISKLGSYLPPELHDKPEIKELLNLGTPKFVKIVHLIYDTTNNGLSSKDYNFASQTLAQHRERGRHDATLAFQESPWLDYDKANHGVNIYSAPNNPEMDDDDLFNSGEYCRLNGEKDRDDCD